MRAEGIDRQSFFLDSPLTFFCFDDHPLFQVDSVESVSCAGQSAPSGRLLGV
jgi:hypothetical protein